MSAETKYCYRCQQDKPLRDFSLGRSGHHHGVCRECRTAANRQRRAALRALSAIKPRDEQEVADLRRALADLRARLAALKGCTDPRCSLCTACLAAMEHAEFELPTREGVPS